MSRIERKKKSMTSVAATKVVKIPGPSSSELFVTSWKNGR